MKKKKNKRKKEKKKKISSVWITLRNTSAFSNEQVWEALTYAVPALKLKNHKKVDVTVTNKSSGNYTGTCYYNGCSWHNTPNPLIITRITSEEKKFPRLTEYEPREGYINSLLLDRMEALILMLSHEFRHLWQKENEGRSRRVKVWGARGIFSERDADAFAIRKVREYRHHQQQWQQQEGYLPDNCIKRYCSAHLVYTSATAAITPILRGKDSRFVNACFFTPYPRNIFHNRRFRPFVCFNVWIVEPLEES